MAPGGLLVAIRGVVGVDAIIVGALDECDVAGILCADKAGPLDPAGRGKGRALVGQQLVDRVGRLLGGACGDAGDGDLRQVIAAVEAGVPVVGHLAVAAAGADMDRRKVGVTDEQEVV